MSVYGLFYIDDCSDIIDSLPVVILHIEEQIVAGIVKITKITNNSSKFIHSDMIPYLFNPTPDDLLYLKLKGIVYTELSNKHIISQLEFAANYGSFIGKYIYQSANI